MKPTSSSQFVAPLNTQAEPLVEAERSLKQLVRQVESVTPLRVFQKTEEAVCEVVLEACIDGLCYQLVRSQPRFERRISLSPRERAIARLIAQGFPNKCIGTALKISPWTVSTYLRRIFIKLGVTSRAAMVARLMEENLLKE